MSTGYLAFIRTETTGVVKLKFFAINNHPILCIRSFNLKRRQNKLEFKTLEQILRTKDLENRDITVNHTCAEIDRQVPELLGVSKAVLENVIFCHQEDSLWPFRDNQGLKTIFDELFQTTKFTKLYETLQRLFKETKNKMKEEKSQLDFYKAHYETLMNDMKGLEQLISNIRSNMSKIKAEEKRKEELQSIAAPQKYDEKLSLLSHSRSLNEYKLKEKKLKLQNFKEFEHAIGGNKSIHEVKQESLAVGIEY